MGKWLYYNSPTVQSTAAIFAILGVLVLLRYAWDTYQLALTSQRQARESTRPVLVVTAVSYRDRKYEFTVENQGTGPALNLKWQLGAEPTDFNQRHGPTTVLGSKSSFSYQFSYQTESDTKLIFLYESTYGERCRTETLLTDELFTNRYYPWEGSRSLRGRS